MSDVTIWVPSQMSLRAWLDRLAETVRAPAERAEEAERTRADPPGVDRTPPCGVRRRRGRGPRSPYLGDHLDATELLAFQARDEQRECVGAHGETVLT